MPRPQGVFNVTIVFNVGNGIETSSNTFWFLNPTVDTLDELTTAVGAAGTHFVDTLVNGGLSGILSNYAKVQSITARGLDGDGGTIVAEGAFPTGSGGTATGALPWDVALVASLRTGTAGRRYRGRVYLGPLGASTMDSSGRVKSSTAEVAASAIAGFLVAMQSDAGAYVPVVWSQTGLVATPITNVIVDDVFDVQRRRQNALIPNKTQVNL